MDNTKSPSGDGFRLLTEQRLQNFWGYGSLNAPTWFVGMEEGLEPHATHEHLAVRFRAAHGKESTDMRRGMEDVPGHIRFFRQGAVIQQSWKYPIALYLNFKLGRQPTSGEIREYQSLKLGDDIEKETMTVELMPLPSHEANERTWLYCDLGISGLSTRAEYLKTYKPERVRKLRELFHTRRPKLAIFYSLSYLRDGTWPSVIGKDPVEITKGMYFAEAEGTACCVIPQGSAPGYLSYEKLREFADKVRDKVHL